jgi:sugar/nucleoside kinase (ribokinase family)
VVVGAANVAAGLAAAGRGGRMIGVLGQDGDAAWLRAGLSERGVDIGGLVVLPGRRSPAALILVDGRGERGDRTRFPAPAPWSAAGWHDWC